MFGKIRMNYYSLLPAGNNKTKLVVRLITLLWGQISVCLSNVLVYNFFSNLTKILEMVKL